MFLREILVSQSNKNIVQYIQASKHEVSKDKRIEFHIASN